MSVKGILRKTVGLPVAIDRWAGAVHGAPRNDKSGTSNDWVLYTMFAR